MKRSSTVVCVSRALAPELAREWAQHWPSWFGPARTPMARAPHALDLAMVETPLGRVVAKRDQRRGWKRRLVAFGVRPSRAELAFARAEALRAHALATPEPLAVLGRAPELVLVTRFVDGLDPWELLARGVPIERLLATLATGLARLHTAGFRHRDLKASNLLLRENDGALELVFTDLDGLRFLGAVELRHRTRDLARLAASCESAAAHAAGIRTLHWDELLTVYLGAALGRVPTDAELGAYRARTRAGAERAIRRHLAQGVPVH